MELGNLIFGNSRGEVRVPRDSGFEGPWEELCAAVGLNWRGYPESNCKVPGDWAVENDVFLVNPYDWDAYCDCGADDEMERWFEAIPHSDGCYQNELRRRKIAAGWVETSFNYLERPKDADFDADRPILKALCKERGLSYPMGCAVHCDCGRDEAAEKKWGEIGGHKSECRLIQPNFLHKPSGFKINWYKYPFRDSYMTPEISSKEWREIVRDCARSAQAGVSVTRNENPLPETP